MDLLEYLTAATDEAITTVTEADKVLLAQLSYVNFEKKVGHDFVFCRDLLPLAETLTTGNYSAPKNERLLTMVAVSRRFANLEVGEVESHFNKTTQYCSMTFRLGQQYFLVYRGTDMSIVGWQEDLALGLAETIPSHRYGLDYAKRVLKKYDGPFSIIGHSKGGNIALYVGMHLADKLQTKVTEIINLDGPGFISDIVQSPKYQQIAKKHFKFIPKDDVVGMLLNNADDYYVVDSKFIGPLQHDLYFWKIENSTLQRLDKTSLFTQIFSKTVASWLASMTPAEKLDCVKAIGDFFRKANITSLNQLKDNTLVSLKDMAFVSLKLPLRHKKLFFTMLFRLIKYSVQESANELTNGNKDLPP